MKGLDYITRVEPGLYINAQHPEFGAVGDGSTDDAAAIQAAWDSAPDNSVVVLPRPSVSYLIGAAGLSLASKTNVHLWGIGAALKLSAVSTQSPAGFGSTTIYMDSCVGCSIKGLEIDGNAKASILIGVDSCTDCEISGNTLTSGGLTAQVLGLGNTRAKYLNNTFSSSIGSSRGIWAGNYASGQMDTDVLIEGNNITDLPATGIVVSSVGGRIAFNKISDLSAGGGIAFGGANGYSSKDLVIVGNTIHDVDYQGIQSDAVYTTDADLPVGISIIGNSISRIAAGSGIYAIYLKDSSIIGNTCQDANVDGITIDESTNLVVKGNTCRDTRSGGSRTQDNGISVGATIDNGTTGIIVEGNQCNNNVTAGIHIATLSPYTIDNVTVANNQCRDNASGILATEDGAGSVTRLVVTGNITKNNSTVDLRIDPLDAVVANNLYTTRGSGTDYFPFTNADATPSVKGGRRYFKEANSGATTITQFDDGVPGQTIEVWFSTGNTTINHGGNFLLKGAANLAPVPGNAFIEFTQISAGFWVETSRNF